MQCKWCRNETGNSNPFCNKECKNAYETHQEDEDYEEERVLDTW